MNPSAISELLGALPAAALSAILAQPLAVHGPSVLQNYALGHIRINIAGAQPAPAQQQHMHPNDLMVYPDAALAIQPVRGVIYGGCSASAEEWNGLFNSDRFHHVCARVAADPGIRTLLFKFDTPGGSVFGLQAAADAIKGLSASRPDLTVASYVQRLCASAGMYLAAATQQIHAAPGAIVGSIGTIACLTDSSGFWNKLGFEKHVFTGDGKYKALGMGGVPPTKEHLAHMDNMVQRYSDEFKGWMKERRGLKPADMQGQIFEARHAPAGMVDSAVFPTFEAFVAAGLTGA